MRAIGRGDGPEQADSGRRMHCSRALVHPGQHPEREHVLRPLPIFLADADGFGGAHGERGHRDAVHHDIRLRVVVECDRAESAGCDCTAVDLAAQHAQPHERGRGVPNIHVRHLRKGRVVGFDNYVDELRSRYPDAVHRQASSGLGEAEKLTQGVDLVVVEVGRAGSRYVGGLLYAAAHDSFSNQTAPRRPLRHRTQRDQHPWDFVRPGRAV